MNDIHRFVKYTLQEVAIIWMVTVYLVRIIWLNRRFSTAAERQPRTGSVNTGPMKGALYSLAVIAMPWTLESVRRHPFLYGQFVVFHVGVAAAIALSIILPYFPKWLQLPPLVWSMFVFVGLGAGAAAIRTVRRFADGSVRAISSVDDFFSLILLTVWLVLALLSVPVASQPTEWSTTAFFGLTAFFLMVVPFSKISHYLYYPFGRYWFGRSMGIRGVYPLVRVPVSYMNQSKTRCRNA